MPREAKANTSHERFQSAYYIDEESATRHPPGDGHLSKLEDNSFRLSSPLPIYSTGVWADSLA